MKKNRLIFLFAAVFFSSPLFAQDAFEFYKSSQYEKAAELFKQEIQKNPFDYTLFYNLGNCHYRLNQKELALANYMKAFNLNPRDSDLFFNLSLLSFELSAGIFNSDIPQAAYRAYYLFSMSELKALINISIWILALCLCIFFLGKLNSLTLNLAYVFLFLLMISSVNYLMRLSSPFHKTAVITSASARMTSGPGEDFKLLATLEKGKIVKILAESSSYVEAGALGEGIKGWLKNEEITKI